MPVSSGLMKLLYMPFRVLAGYLAHRAGNQAFGAIWSKVSDSDRPPSTNAARRPLAAVAGGAALQAAVLAACVAVSDQLAARLFFKLFGSWPGSPSKADDTEQQSHAD